MGSQFVDLDGDGHTDYLTAIFDGSPHVARGSEDGFAAPETLMDKDGRRVILSYYWDHDKDQHVVDGRAMGTEDFEQERLISALAYDWDGDGDHDLLLGSYENGRLYRQMNEGTDAEPQFTGRNIAVMAGDKAFALPAKMTAPVLADWDGDGDRDLITGSFGETEGESGGVYLSLNEGREGAPRFGDLIALVAPREGYGEVPERPDTGLYPAVADWDADGDLDLLVGGTSTWQLKGRELTPEEQEEVVELRSALEAADAVLFDLNRRTNVEIIAATEGLDRESDEYDEIVGEIYAKYEDEYEAASARTTALRSRLESLVPPRMRRSFVWLYEQV